MYTIRFLSKEEFGRYDVPEDMKVRHMNDLKEMLKYISNTCDKYRIRIEYERDTVETVAWIVGKIPYTSLENLEIYKVEETYQSLGVHELIVVG